MKLADILDAGLILPDLKAVLRPKAFEEMAGALAARTALPAADIVEALAEREATRPTAMEKGVAIPHARLDGVNRFFLLVARSASGIDFKAEDKSLSKLFFMIVGPENKPHDYLRLLARVARVCQSDSFRAKLLAATSALDMAAIIREEDGKV